jgi:hypothetical protein
LSAPLSRRLRPGARRGGQDLTALPPVATTEASLFGPSQTPPAEAAAGRLRQAEPTGTSWRRRESRSAERGMRGAPLKTGPGVSRPAHPFRSFETRRARAGRKSGLTVFRKAGAKKTRCGGKRSRGDGGAIGGNRKDEAASGKRKGRSGMDSGEWREGNGQPWTSKRCCLHASL